MLEIVTISLLSVLQQENVNVVREGKNVVKPSGYEVNLLALDNISSIVKTLEKEEVLIVVSHLGKGENPVYSQRRLYTVKTYLKLSESKIVTAIGEPVDGYGYLDFYIKGKKSFSLAANKNQEIWVGEGDPESFRGFPSYYLPKPKYHKSYKLPSNK